MTVRATSAFPLSFSSSPSPSPSDGAPAIPAWPAALLLAAVLLLGVFHQVVRQAVADGEARRAAMAARQQAMWRCNALRDRRERGSCLAAVAGASAPATVPAAALRRVAIDDGPARPRPGPARPSDPSLTSRNP